MKTFIAIVEQCPETGLYIGNVPSFPDADLQAETLDELYHDLREFFEMLIEDNSSVFKDRFVATQTVMVA